MMVKVVMLTALTIILFCSSFVFLRDVEEDNEQWSWCEVERGGGECLISLLKSTISKSL